MKKLIYVSVLWIFLYKMSAAQRPASQVSGKVVDAASGMALHGATVLHQLSGKSTLTDSSGHFGLALDSISGTLEITYSGYKPQQVAVGLQVLVRLQAAANTLQEVVVSNGYQQIPRERSAGSFDKIGEPLVNRTISTNILDRMEGMLSSVYLNRGISFPPLSVRGLSSISSGITQPLIVVDHFPYEGNLNNLNPNDVESITVLKDAAATSIWGARAGNGVIVITTKKGRAGAKPQLSFRANLTMQETTRVKDLPWMDSGSFLEVEDFLFQRNYYNNLFTNVSSRPLISPYVEDLNRHRLGQISGEELATRRARYAAADFRDQSSDHLYQPGLKQQYSMQFSGGNNMVQYLLSGGLDINRETDVLSTNNRKTFMAQLTIQPDVRTRIAFTGNFSFSETVEPVLTGVNMAPGGGRARYYPYARLADENGQHLALERDFRKVFQDTTGAGLLLPWQYIPLDEMEQVQPHRLQNDSWLQLSARRQIIKGLSAEIYYQYQMGTNQFERVYRQESYFSRYLVNIYSQRTATGITRPLPLGGVLDKSSIELASHSGRFQLQWDKQFDEWKVNALAGTEIRKRTQESFGSRRYGYNSDILSSASVDHATVFPQWANLRSAQAITPQLSQGATDLRFTSLYANGAATYKQRFIANASIRKDASNILGVSTNQRGVPLFSTGLAWVMSEEGWWNKGLFNFMKLRATYGSSGNVNPDLSALSTIAYRAASTNILNLPFAVVQNAPNPSLKWEKVNMINLGIDFEVTGGWLSGSLEWYNKKSTDLFTNAPIDPTTGLVAFIRNAGNLGTHGIDLNIQTKLGGKYFSWESQVLASYVYSEIESLANSSVFVSGLPSQGGVFVSQVGYAPNALFSYRWAGLDPQNGDPQGYVNKEVSKDYNMLTFPSDINELVYHGSTRASYFGSWRNTFRYRSFAVSALILGEFGHYFRAPTINYSNLFGSWVTHSDYSKRWQQPGDELHTNVPSMVYPANFSRDQFYELSEVTVDKADHIRLQDIRLDYFFNVGKAKKAGFNVYIIAQNPGMIWKATSMDIDPVYPFGLPPQKAVTFGTLINL